MPDPNKLAAASSFDSFKQFGSSSTSVSISGVVPGTIGADYLTFSNTVSLDRANISYQVYMTSSLFPTKRYSLGGGYAPERTGSIPGPVSVAYNVFFSFGYSGATLTCTALTFNPYGLDLSLQSETITFDIRPFVSPF